MPSLPPVHAERSQTRRTNSRSAASDDHASGIASSAKISLSDPWVFTSLIAPQPTFSGGACSRSAASPSLHAEGGVGGEAGAGRVVADRDAGPVDHVRREVG